MNYEQCMDSLLEADLARKETRHPGFDDDMLAEAASHIGSCERCTRAVGVLREAQSALRLALDAVGVSESPEHLADESRRRVKRERLVKWIIAPVAVLIVAVISAVAFQSMKPEVERLVAPQPPAETRTFSLTCLSGEQAAGLLQPYLPRPQNPRWQAEAYDVRPVGGGISAVTVRAPKATLDQVPALLERFERDPDAACRVSSPPKPAQP